MSKSTNYKVRLGLFVTTGLVIFAIGMYSMGNRQNLFSNNFEINVHFRQVSGLQSGNNVRFSGIDVGTVKDIEIVNDSTVLVILLVRERVRQFIKRDAVASIGSDGLMGNMLVNITPGNSQMPALNDGGTIQSFELMKTEDILNTLSNSNENLALLIGQLLEITQGVNKGNGTVGLLMKDSTLAKDLKVIIANLKTISSQSFHTINGVQELVTNLQEGDGLVNKLFTDTTQAQSLERIMDNLELSSQGILKASQRLNNIAQNTEIETGVIYTMTKDSLFNADLRQTMKEVKEGTAKFNENMTALQKNWLFRKYFKKKEEK